MGIIGTILCFVGGIGMLVFWIMILIKQFKKGETLWGVLSIFFGILAPIWAFMNGEKTLGIRFVVCFVLYLIGIGIALASGVSSMQGLETPQ